MDIMTVLQEYAKKKIPFRVNMPISDMPQNYGEDIAPLLVGARRELLSFVSMIAWTTHNDGTEEFYNLSIDSSLNFCSRLKYTDGYENQEHTHDYIELCYVAEGSLTIYIAGGAHVIGKGDFCLISSNSPHHEKMNHNESSVVYLGIDNSLMDNSYNENYTATYTNELLQFINKKRSEYSFMRFFRAGKEQTETEKTLAMIATELIGDIPGRKHIIQGYAERIISQLIQEYRADITKSDRNELRKAIAASIGEYIDTNLSTVTVDDIQKHFHYSADHLTRLFKAEYGMTLSLAIQNRRLVKAYDLLMSTNESVETICRLVGYKNIGFFYSKFKSKYGKKPGEIRN